MIIKDYDLNCINIECWNLDEDDSAYEDGINADGPQQSLRPPGGYLRL